VRRTPKGNSRDSETGCYVRHDIANEYGNWDHVAVGPPGVFMVESKRLSGRRIEIERDGLSSGRLHFGGKTFRGASAGLRHALLAQARGALTCHSQSKEELKCHPGVPSVLPTHPVRPLA
jgi:hypothetical protein